MENLNVTLSKPPEASSPLDDPVGIVQLSVYVVTFLVGSVGNILVIVIVKGKRSRRSVNDLYIMNLAIADLMFIAFLPIYVYDMFDPVRKSVGICKFIPPVMTMTYFLSVYTLTFMAVHRCYVILNPFKPDMRHRNVYISIAIIWIISALFIMPLVIVGDANEGACSENWPTSIKRAYTLSLVILQYVLPLTIITVAYIRIIFDLNHSSASKFERHTQVHQQFRKENLQIVKTLATIVILFAVCLLPGQVFWMIVDFGTLNDPSSGKIFYSASVILSALHSCLNPIVYGTLTKQFRREYLRYFLYVFQCCRRQCGYRKHYSQAWNSHTITPNENNNKTEHQLLHQLSVLDSPIRESRV